MTVRESLAAHPGREKTAPPPGRQPGAPDNVTRLPRGPGTPGPLPDPRGPGLLDGLCGQAGHADGWLLNGRAPGLRRLFGRLAALFYAGCGALGLLTLALPAPGSDTEATAAVYAAAVVIGIAIWLVPWERWPRAASLAILPPAFALIALLNTFGGQSMHIYGVFFVVAFVWTGMAHPPRTSAAMAPLAAAAYILPLFVLPGSIGAGLSSAALTIPVCVLVGEGLAWGMSRLERIELALVRERDRTEQLRELDEMKDRFLSTVSHELRTPITICRGHLEVLDEGAGCQELHTVRDLLVGELDYMGRMVEDLTTLAWLDDASLLRPQSLPLDTFMISVSAKAETLLGDRVRTRPAATGASLRADPQRLSQALMNLLQNAADHTRGQDPVRFSVRACRSGWRFEVADEGGGLLPGDEQVVFEPFSTGSSGGGGTGLGLSIVRGIAQAHGGECGVVNQPGRGAAFWIRIPR